MLYEFYKCNTEQQKKELERNQVSHWDSQPINVIGLGFQETTSKSGRKQSCKTEYDNPKLLFRSHIYKTVDQECVTNINRKLKDVYLKQLQTVTPNVII